MPDRDPQDDAALLDRLCGLKARGRRYGLDRLRLLAPHLGHPERGLSCIHVAGTNGKGSVAAMIESILRAAGWRTGLYTSPHLVHVGERVQVNRVPLTTAQVADYVRFLYPLADAVAAEAGADDRPSFFEYMTAMALLEFARQRCDLAVIEVGLGGEFDATNIVLPEVAVIASIGLDHCEWLGSTLGQIASAKAGIVKPGRPLVIGRLPAEAEAVIRARAAAVGAPVLSVREAYGEEIAAYPHTNLLGDYQRWNAATATLAVRTLAARWRIGDEAIVRGLGQVDWPGRWQRVRVGERSVILDASHNPEGAAVLAANLGRLVAETGRRPIVVTGVLGAERARPLLVAIARHAAEIHLVVPNQPRACSHAELAALVPADFSGRLVRTQLRDVFPRPDYCALGAAGEPVVVTGSIYLLGEVLARLGATVPGGA